MTEQILEILNRYGQPVTLRLAEGDVHSRAFLQPLKERNERVPKAVTPLGTIDGRLWLYLGRAAVKPEDCILWNEMKFRVRSSRPYYMGETLLYWWACLEQAKEAAE